MSSNSQTSSGRMTDQVWRVTVWVAIACIVVAAVVPIGGSIVRAAAAARAYAPDLGILARQSPAVQIHLGAAVAALALGASLMFARKGRRFHRAAGWLWVGLVSMVAGSSLFITGLNGDQWSLLHLLTGWTFIALPLGVVAARSHKVARHRRFMTGLFYGGFAINLFIAFIPGRLLWRVAFG